MPNYFTLLLLLLLSTSLGCQPNKPARKRIQFPKEEENEEDVRCKTSSGEPGKCVDVHLCQVVLLQVLQHHLFPTLCRSNNPDQLVVCCPEGEETTCGVVFPVGQGFEAFSESARLNSDISSSSSNENRFSSIRRPWQQEALLAMARANYGEVEKRELSLLGEDDGHSLTNGVDAEEAEFPWAAALAKKISGNRLTWFCGGSLVSPKWVLTAAHCVDKVRVDVVRLGAIELDPPSPHFADFGVSATVIHPEFDLDHALYHDLAMLRLDGRAGVNRFVQPVCLPPPSSLLSSPPLPRDTAVSTAGFGQLAFGGVASSALKKSVGLTTVPRRNCEDAFGNRILRGRFPEGLPTSTTLCAIDSTNHSDPCQGDSGGGLVLREEEEGAYGEILRVKTLLVGVVTGGVGCGSHAFPGIYATVGDEHLDWIRETMKGY